MDTTTQFADISSRAMINITFNRDREHEKFMRAWPRAGSGVVRIDPLRFLAGCRTRQLNQA